MSDFNFDRYRGTYTSYYHVTEEYYKVIGEHIWEDDDYLGFKRTSCERLDDLTEEYTGKDNNRAVSKVFFTEEYTDDNLKTTRTSRSPYKGSVTTHYKKITVRRKLAVEFEIDDVFDWQKDFIKGIYLLLYNNSNIKDKYLFTDALLPYAGVGRVHPGGTGELKYAYTISGPLSDTVAPANMEEFDQYLESTETIKKQGSDTINSKNYSPLDIGEVLPRENNKFLFLIDVPWLYEWDYMKDPLTDPVTEDEQPHIPWEKLDDVPGVVSLFGTDYFGNDDLTWLHLERRSEETASGQTTLDWHKNFKRTAEGVYVSKSSFIDSLVDFGKITDSYYAYGGKLQIELFKEKTSNKKNGAKEVYFDETFYLEPFGLNVFEREAIYEQCDYDEEYERFNDNLILLNHIPDEDKEIFDVILEADPQHDPFDDPPNGKYWTHELLLKEEINDLWPSREYSNIMFGRYIDDVFVQPENEWRYIWRGGYGDYTMFESSSAFKDNDRIISKVEDNPYFSYITGFADSNYYSSRFNPSSRRDSNNDIISFVLWDCVLETPGAFTEEQILENGSQSPEDPQTEGYNNSNKLKTYYHRVPLYGDYGSSKIKITLKDFKNYDITVTTEDVYNKSTNANPDCREIGCLLGPNVPDWQITNEEFEDLGTPTEHTLISYGDCAAEITAIKKEHKIGSVTYSLVREAELATYNPTADVIYTFGDGVSTTAAGYAGFADIYFQWYECINGEIDSGNSEAYVMFGKPSAFTKRWGSVTDIAPFQFGDGRNCCGLQGFEQMDWWRTASVGTVATICGNSSECMSYVASTVEGYLLRPLEDLYVRQNLEVFLPNEEYNRVHVDNNFASTHKIHTTVEPYLQFNSFEEFRRGSLGETDLLLGVPTMYRKYIFSIQVWGDFFYPVPIQEGATFRVRKKGVNDEELYEYVAGAGLRFRTTNMSFCPDEERTKNDFDVLYQQNIPIISVYDKTWPPPETMMVQDAQLDQEDIDEIAGFLTDFSYRYVLDGQFYIEDADGDETIEVNGQELIVAKITNPMFKINPDGSVDGPLTGQDAIGFFDFEFDHDVAVYDQVQIIYDGYFTLGEYPECNIESYTTDLSCLYARGFIPQVHGFLTNLNDDPSVVYRYEGSNCVALGSSIRCYSPEIGARYKTTRSGSQISVPSVPSETVYTEHNIGARHRRRDEKRSIVFPYDEDDPCPYQEYESVFYEYTGWYSVAPEAVRYPVVIEVPTPPEGCITRYSLDPPGPDPRIEGTLFDDSPPVTMNGYGSYFIAPDSSWDNSYSYDGSYTFQEQINTEWRDFPVSQGVINLSYKKTVTSDSCGRYLLLDFTKDDLIGYCPPKEGERDTLGVYVQDEVIRTVMNREQQIRAKYHLSYYDELDLSDVDPKYINPDLMREEGDALYLDVDKVIGWYEGLVGSVSYDFTKHFSTPYGYGPWLSGFNQEFWNDFIDPDGTQYLSYLQIHKYGIDFTYAEAREEFMKDKNLYARSLVPDLKYSILSDQLGYEHFDFWKIFTRPIYKEEILDENGNPVGLRGKPCSDILKYTPDKRTPEEFYHEFSRKYFCEPVRNAKSTDQTVAPDSAEMLSKYHAAYYKDYKFSLYKGYHMGGFDG